MDEGALAAARRSPAQQRLIETLAASDESFQSLCDDLAAAATTLAGWQASTAVVREARYAEYRDLVEDLVREIEVALRSGRRDD
jgi:hypothetical protein